MYGSDIFPNGFTPIMLTANKLCSLGFLSPVCIQGMLLDSVHNDIEEERDQNKPICFVFSPNLSFEKIVLVSVVVI